MNRYPSNLILFGGCSLAFGAACANVGFLLESGVSISHLTGNVSQLATELSTPATEREGNGFYVAMAALGFFLGALFCGVLIHHPVLELERPYGRMIVTIGLLFLGAWLLGPYWAGLAIFVSAFSCGMQNSLATRYRGLVLRTTHLTGLITDIGVNLGMVLRGHRIEGWKLSVPLLLSLFFFLGAGFGGLLELFVPRSPLLFAGLLYLIGGGGWAILQRYRGRMKRGMLV
jgi:uncharacterized membrane protein YoaK (UPF0700 family)